METLIIVIAIATIIAIVTATSRKAQLTSTKRPYSYISKQKIMTNAEARFFEKLTRVTGDRFYILPQMHLSTFIDHKIKGQNWKAAFSTINGKSVDFLLVEKTTLRPVIAIELDDWSHDKAERIERDQKVEDILASANILLARFDGPDILDQDIIDKIYHLATNK